MLRFLFSAAIGAAAAYFLDPDNGRDRRTLAARRLQAFRSRSAGSGRHASRVASYFGGTRQFMGRFSTPDSSDPNDPTLVQKVETEVFRDPEIPKGQININAEDGMVVLRGQLDDPDQILRVEESVRAIPGVEGVENLLHLPDTPAPHAT
jgi:hypothetical protein